MGNLDGFRRYYEEHKDEMDEFLRSCADRGRSGDAKELFKWLCCNLLASQAKWEEAKEAVECLDKENHLFDGDSTSIHSGLKNCGYRSPNNKKKAEWLYEARRRFYDKKCEIGIVDLVSMLGAACGNNPFRTRNLLAERSRDNHISGLGMKEASHFLRGLGFSHNQLAILDNRILGELVCFHVIEKKRERLTRKEYLVIERAVKDWAETEIPIPLDGLDWLLWKMGRTGEHSC
jgi:thermostable 8-oxoguanine DNA glycosylase